MTWPDHRIAIHRISVARVSSGRDSHNVCVRDECSFQTFFYLINDSDQLNAFIIIHSTSSDKKMYVAKLLIEIYYRFEMEFVIALVKKK